MQGTRHSAYDVKFYRVAINHIEPDEDTFRAFQLFAPFKHYPHVAAYIDKHEWQHLTFFMQTVSYDTRAVTPWVVSHRSDADVKSGDIRKKTNVTLPEMCSLLTTYFKDLPKFVKYKVYPLATATDFALIREKAADRQNKKREALRCAEDIQLKASVPEHIALRTAEKLPQPTWDLQHLSEKIRSLYEDDDEFDLETYETVRRQIGSKRPRPEVLIEEEEPDPFDFTEMESISSVATTKTRVEVCPELLTDPDELCGPPPSPANMAATVVGRSLSSVRTAEPEMLSTSESKSPERSLHIAPA